MKKSAFLFLCIYLFYSWKPAVAQCPMPSKITAPAVCSNKITSTSTNLTVAGDWCLNTASVTVTGLNISASGTLNIYINKGETLNLSDLTFKSAAVNIYILPGGSLKIANNITIPAGASIYNYGTLTINANLTLSGNLLNYYAAKVDMVKTSLTLSGNASRFINKGEAIINAVSNQNFGTGAICLSSGSCTRTTNFSSNTVYPVTFSDSTGEQAYFYLAGNASLEGSFTSSENIRVCSGPNSNGSFVNWGNATFVENCSVPCATVLKDTNSRQTVKICGSLGYFSIYIGDAIGGLGSYSYQWQSTSDTLKAPWADIPNASLNVLYRDSLVKTTYFRRKVTDAGQTAYSKTLSYIIQPGFYTGHIVKPASVCKYSSVNLKLDTLPVDPLGGKIHYEWQIETEGYEDTGDTTSVYTTPELYYSLNVRLAVNSSRCQNSIPSKAVNIQTIPSIKEYGENTITDNQVLCAVAVPKPLNGSYYENNSIVYSWLSSSKPTGPWVKQGSAQNFSPATINATTYFIRTVSSPNYCYIDTSNVISVVIGDGFPLHVYDPNDNLTNPTCGMLRYAVNYANKKVGYDTIAFSSILYGKNVYLLDSLIIRDGLTIKGSSVDPVNLSGEQLNNLAPALINFSLPATDVTTSSIQGVKIINTNLRSQASLMSFGPLDKSRKNLGSFYLKDCNIENNSFIEGANGMYFEGKNLTVENCYFNNNTVPYYTYYNTGTQIVTGTINGKILFLNSNFNRNGDLNYLDPQGSSSQGGIILLQNAGTYECRIEKCTFSNNIGYNAPVVSYLGNGISDSLVIYNSTFSNNIVEGNGGAISASGKVSLYNNTIVSNNAYQGSYSNDGTVYFGGRGGALYLDILSKIRIKNTIIAKNHANTSGQDIYNINSSFVSLGNNIFGIVDTTSVRSALKATDKSGTVAKPLDPVLTPLIPLGSKNILAHLPVTGSPAIDKGASFTGMPATDQIGSARVIGSSVDIGSIEVTACTAPYLVTSNKDTYTCGTLRYAVTAANAVPGEQTITFASKFSSDSILLGSVLEITDALKMKGIPGLIISGDGNTNLIYSMSLSDTSKITYSNIIFKNGYIEGNSNGSSRIESSGLSKRLSDASIGTAAVSHYGTGSLVFKTCDFINNYGALTGALSIEDANITIDSCRFIGNGANSSSYTTCEGGGFLYYTSVPRTVSIKNTYFKENALDNGYYSTSNGGALALHLNDSASTATIENCTFENNSAGFGGGLYLSSDENNKTRIINSTFTGNDAINGGALFTGAAGLKLVNTTIHKNSATYSASSNYNNDGGGIYVESGEVKLQNSVISKNTAPYLRKDFANFGGVVTSLGNNFITDTTGSGMPNFSRMQLRWDNSDIIGDANTIIEPKFYPLANNGGLTPNFLPSVGSPLIDKGQNNVGFSLPKDQRGQTRVQNLRIDIGSVESSPLIVKAGRDTVLCDTVYTLRATAVQAPLRGFWSIKGKKAKGIITDSSLYNSKTKVSATDTMFVWNVTDGSYLQSDTVIIKSYYNKVKPNAGIDRIVYADTTTLSGNIVAGTVPRWRRLSGTSVIADTTKSVTKVSKLIVGANKFEYRYGKSPCISRDSIIVTYQIKDTAIAGKDITVCTDTSHFTARKPKAGFHGKWTIFKGSLKLTNDTLFNTKITGIKDSIATLIWKVSNPVTLLSSSDTINVSFRGVTTQITKPGIKDTIFAISPAIALGGTATGFAVTYQWFENKTLLSTSLNTNATAKTDTTKYKLRVSNSSCSVQDSFLLIIIDTTKAFAGADQQLCSDTTTLHATKPLKGGKGKWTIFRPAQSSIILANDTLYNTKIKGIPSGTAILIWTLINKQTTTRDTVKITNNFNPVKANAGPDKTIFTDTTTLTGNKDGNSLMRWRTKGTATFTDSTSSVTKVQKLQLGVNKFVYVFLGNCQRTDTVNVTYTLPPDTAKAGPDKQICGDTTTLAAVKTSTLAGAWRSKGKVVFSDSTSIKSRVSNLAFGPNLLYWVLKSGNKVTSIDSVVITNNLSPVKANAGIDKTVTTDTTGLKGNTDGNTLTRWRSKGPAFVSDSVSSITKITNLQVGVNRFVYVFLGQCLRTDTVLVTYNLPADIAEAGKDTSVCTTSFTLAAIPASGNKTGAWRSKSNVVFSDSTLFNSKVEKLPLGPTKLYWVIKVGNKVQSKDSVIITNKSIIADAGMDDYACGPIGHLSGSSLKAGESGTWTSLSAFATVSPATSPNASVNMMRTTGHKFKWFVTNTICEDADTVEYFRSDSIRVAQHTDSIAAGSPIVIDVRPNDKFSSIRFQIITVENVNTPYSLRTITGITKTDNQIIINTNPLIINKDSVEYLLTNQCPVFEDYAKVYIKTLNTPPKLVSVPEIIDKDGKLSFILTQSTLDINQNVKSIRDIGNVLPVKITMLSDASFLVEIDYAGSPETDGEFNLRLEVCDGSFPCPIIDIPVSIKGTLVFFNAVSPNNDGKNDYFHIQGVHKYKNNKLQIFNRWGDVVFSEKEYNNANVKFDGGELPDGTYYFVFDKGEGSKVEEGYILLKR